MPVYSFLQRVMIDYLEESKGEIMTSYTNSWGNMWVQKLEPYYGTEQVCHCPTKGATKWSYGYNDWLTTGNAGWMNRPGKQLDAMEEPTNTTHIADGFARMSASKVKDWTDPQYRHSKKSANILFLDISVRLANEYTLSYSDPYQRYMVNWY